MNKYGAMVEWLWQGKPEYSAKYMSHCYFVYYKSHMDWAGIKLEPPLCHYTVPQSKDHISHWKPKISYELYEHNHELWCTIWYRRWVVALSNNGRGCLWWGGMTVGRANCTLFLNDRTNATETIADFLLLLWGFIKSPYSYRKRNVCLSFQVNLKAR